MLKISPNRIFTNVVLVLLCTTTALTYISHAAVRTNRRQSRTQDRSDRSTADMRSQQLQSQQEKLTKIAQDAAEQIDSKLAEMLELVNKNKRPNRRRIESALQTVDDTAKFLSTFDGGVQCQHFMLKAWGNYFNDDPAAANNAATRAYRADQNNNDAFITQAAIAVLAGNKPVTVKPERQPSAAISTRVLPNRLMRVLSFMTFFSTP